MFIVQFVAVIRMKSDSVIRALFFWVEKRYTSCFGNSNSHITHSRIDLRFTEHSIILSVESGVLFEPLWKIMWCFRNKNKISFHQIFVCESFPLKFQACIKPSCHLVSINKIIWILFSSSYNAIHFLINEFYSNIGWLSSLKMISALKHVRETETKTIFWL